MSIDPGIRSSLMTTSLGPSLLAVVVRLGVAAFLGVVAVLTVLLLCVSPAEALVPLSDYNEPNDGYATATTLKRGVTDYGAIQSVSDRDYFYLDLPKSQLVTVEFTTGGYLRDCRLFFEATGASTPVELTSWDKEYDDDGSFIVEGTVGPGRLFAIVSVGNGEPGTTAYTVTVTYADAGTATFPDVPADSDFYGAITYLADEGVVSGYADGRFGPSDKLTRQQFAKMIVRAVGYPVFASDVCPFTDVSTSYPGHYVDHSDPLYPDHYVAVAAGHHITVGLTPSTFGPYQNIKMAQVTTMVVRTAEDLGLWDSPPSSYVPSFADFGEPHYPYARTGAAHGLFSGYPGPWDWFSPATRGQCAYFIWKLMVAYSYSQSTVLP